VRAGESLIKEDNMIRLYLTSSEIEICHYIGKYRNAITSKQGVDRKQDQAKDNLQISIDGVISEYAVAKALNVNFDLNCDYRKFGADLKSRKGNQIDVKSTTTIGGNLNAVIWSERKSADIFILTEIHSSFVGLIGWIDKERLLIPENIKNVGYGDYYSISQSKLFSLDEFVVVS